MTDCFFSHPILSAWTADEETSDALSWRAELDAMLAFETALAGAEARHGIISAEAAAAVSATCGSFEPDIDLLRASTKRDGVMIPGLVAQLRRVLGPDFGAAVHFGATSQDVIDTALMLRLKPLLQKYRDRLSGLLEVLEGLDRDWGDRPLLAYTRLRAALPISVSVRVASWRSGLAAGIEGLDRSLACDIAVQLAGPVGTLDRLGAAAPAVRADLARALGLGDPHGSWHTDRGRLRRIAAALGDVTTVVGKIGLDFGLMAQDGIGTIGLAGGASSSMAHKVNPVAAELLVALARYHASLLGGLGQAGIQEFERSGSGWTLEWALMPQILLTTGGALVAAERLLASVQRIGDP